MEYLEYARELVVARVDTESDCEGDIRILFRLVAIARASLLLRAAVVLSPPTAALRIFGTVSTRRKTNTIDHSGGPYHRKNRNV